MRIAHLTIIAAAALATFVAGSSAITAQPRRRASTAPLFPLSERDLSATREIGLRMQLPGRPRRVLVQMISDELIGPHRRRAAGLPRSTTTILGAFERARERGLRRDAMSLRPTGRADRGHMESDSAEAPGRADRIAKAARGGRSPVDGAAHVEGQASSILPELASGRGTAGVAGWWRGRARWLRQ